MKGLKLRQKGDTILEVMICVAVVGLLLTAAFALANKNTIAELKSQERSKAVKIAETQLELLKSYADINKLPDKSTTFCMVSDASQPTGTRLVPIAAGQPQANRVNDNNPGVYPAECKSDGLYQYALWSPNRSGGALQGKPGIPYAVTVRWDAAGGGARQEVKYFYNLYDTSDPAFGVVGSPPEECRNGYDDADPEDTAADYPADIGCSSLTDTDETNPQCSDGINNDPAQDGLTDSADPGCRSGCTWVGTVCNGGIYNPLINSENDPPKPPPPPPARVPLYRCYQFYLFNGNYRTNTNHYYTLNPAECNGGNFGGNLEGIMGYVPLASNPGAVPYYGGRHPGYVDDFYTTSWAEYVNAHNNYGFNQNSGIRFYVYPYNGSCSVPGTVPIYRWWSDFVGNHVYTINPAENPNNYSSVDGGGTYSYEFIDGCIFSGP